MSCASSAFCVAAGVAGDRSDIGGSVDLDSDGSWSASQISDDRSVSFEKQGGPEAIDRQMGMWGVPLPVDPGQSLRSLSCPTSHFCIAVDGAGTVVAGGPRRVH